MIKHNNNYIPYTDEEKHKYTSYITDSIVWWLKDKTANSVSEQIIRGDDVASMLISAYPKFMVKFGRSLVGKRGIDYLSILDSEAIYKTIDNVFAVRPDVGLVFWANKKWYINVIIKILDEFIGRSEVIKVG